MSEDLFVGESGEREYVITVGVYRCKCKSTKPEHIFQENLVIASRGNMLEVKHGMGGSKSKIETITTFPSTMEKLAKLFCEGRILKYAKERHEKMRHETGGYNTELINLLDAKQREEYRRRIGAA